MHQAHLTISGSVQGVNFRYFVKHAAKQNNVTGWIKNLPDGRVEAILQGRKGDIEQLILLCRKGPMLSEVRDVQVEWEEVIEKFEDLVITS